MKPADNIEMLTSHMRSTLATITDERHKSLIMELLRDQVDLQIEANATLPEEEWPGASLMALQFVDSIEIAALELKKVLNTLTDVKASLLAFRQQLTSTTNGKVEVAIG